MAGAKILVVDDDHTMLAVVQATLESEGHEVLATDSPGDAMSLLRVAAVDAAVLDVLMPEVDGFEVLKRIRAHAPTSSIPVLMLSALGEGGDRVRGLKEGADDYLVKPFEPEELVLRMERLLATPRPADEEIPAQQGVVEEIEERIREGRSVEGLSLGRYRLRSLIGVGASGMVFRGWDPSLERPVALKTIRLEPEASGPTADSVGLQEEAVRVARLSHPNVVAVHDVGNEPIPYIVMGLIEGCSLHDRIDDGGPLAGDQVVVLGHALASGLSAAHRAGMVHHDVKPANVLLGRDGSIKLVDFGIARLLTRIHEDAGRIFGTPGFLPPETLKDTEYSERSDLFALGCVLYFAAVGRSPFAGGTLHDTLARTCTVAPEAPRRLGSDLAPVAEDLLLGMLDKDPTSRPRSASEVAERLGEMVASHGWRWRSAPSQGATLRRHRSSAHGLTLDATTTPWRPDGPADTRGVGDGEDSGR